eukprot:g4077.t1
MGTNKSARDTALIAASIGGCSGTVQALVDAGADRGAESLDGKTALEYARELGHAQSVEVLEAQLEQQESDVTAQLEQRDARIHKLEVQLEQKNSEVAGSSVCIKQLETQVGRQAKLLSQQSARIAELEPTVHDLTSDLKRERTEAEEDAQDEAQTYAQFIDRQQSKIDRLKKLCADNGIDGALIQAAIVV